MMVCGVNVKMMVLVGGLKVRGSEGVGWKTLIGR